MTSRLARLLVSGLLVFAVIAAAGIALLPAREPAERTLTASTEPPVDPNDPDQQPEPTGDLVQGGPQPDLVFLATGGVAGYVEPCGCPKNPAGGLARRAGYRELFARIFPDTPVVLVDTGDFSGEPDEAGAVKTGNLLSGMATMEYSVVNVGGRELAAGVPAFADAIRDQKVLYVSATYVDRDSREPLFPPFAIREYTTTGGLKMRVGFIGIDAFNSSFVRPKGDGGILVTLPPSDALARVLPKVRPNADMVVLLANLSVRELTGLLEGVAGVDLALASHGTRMSPGGALETFGSVPVLYSGDQGKRMGEVRVFLDAAQGTSRLEGQHVWLTRRYPALPGLQKLIDETIARVNDINRSRAAQQPPVVPAAAEGAAEQRRFLTVEACRSCHAVEHEIWAASAHAHAFKTLVDANQDFNVECVSCHVTGFDTPGGFVNARRTPGLMNVQCEACHGDATGHVADLQKPYGDVPPRQCFTCHTKENSPDFVFFPYWDMIKH